MGASLGTALLNTIAATATTAYLVHHASGAGVRARDMVSAALVHGYATAAGCAALVLVAAAVTVAALVNTARPTRMPESAAR
jgi:hypothetical protein